MAWGNIIVSEAMLELEYSNEQRVTVKYNTKYNFYYKGKVSCHAEKSYLQFFKFAWGYSEVMKFIHLVVDMKSIKYLCICKRNVSKGINVRRNNM